MEFLRSFRRRHFTGKPLVASRNVGRFLRLTASLFLILTSAKFVVRAVICLNEHLLSYAGDVNVRLKTINKYNSVKHLQRQQFSFTKARIGIKVSL